MTVAPRPSTPRHIAPAGLWFIRPVWPCQLGAAAPTDISGAARAVELCGRRLRRVGLTTHPPADRPVGHPDGHGRGGRRASGRRRRTPPVLGGPHRPRLPPPHPVAVRRSLRPRWAFASLRPPGPGGARPNPRAAQRAAPPLVRQPGLQQRARPQRPTRVSWTSALSTYPERGVAPRDIQYEVFGPDLSGRPTSIDPAVDPVEGLHASAPVEHDEHLVTDAVSALRSGHVRR